MRMARRGIAGLVAIGVFIGAAGVRADVGALRAAVEKAEPGAVAAAARTVAAQDNAAAVKALGDGIEACGKLYQAELARYVQNRKAIQHLQSKTDKDLGKSGSDEFDKHLIASYTLSDRLLGAERSCLAIAQACSAIASDGAVKALIQRASSGQKTPLGDYYAEAMGHVNHADVVPALVKMLERSSSWRVKVACLDALGMKRSERALVLSTLTPWLGDSDPRIMRAAHAARQAVTGEGPVKPAAAPAEEEKGKKKKKKKKDKGKDGGAAAAPAPVEEGTLVSTGKGSHATFYKMRVLSNSVMFVVDSSWSMEKDDRIGTLKEELRKVIGGLPDKARANIVDFNCLVRFMTPSMIELNARTRPAVGKHIDEIETKFVTNTYETFQTVFRIIRGELGATVQTGKQKGVADTIYFLTDGKPTVPSRLRKAENARFMNPDNIVECVKFWNRRCRVTIHTIGIGDGKGTFLEKLAAANNGKYVSH